MNLLSHALLVVQSTGRLTEEAILRGELLLEKDPYGFIMSLVGMSVVFFSLVVIYYVFSKMRILFTPAFKQKSRFLFQFGKSKEEKKVVAQVSEEELSGEVNAAIAAAIHLYRSELHDYENTVLTIKKVARTYSPWSSKIYGVRNPLQN